MTNKISLRKKKERKKKGFTLIELVISLAIMAVIALIALPNFNSIKESSKVKADRQSAESIKRTVQLLIVDETIKLSGSENIELTYNATSKEFGNDNSVSGLDELKKALAYVNPPATDKNAPYVVNISKDGDNVVVAVNGKSGTSTGSTSE